MTSRPRCRSSACSDRCPPDERPTRTPLPRHNPRRPRPDGTISTTRSEADRGPPTPAPAPGRTPSDDPDCRNRARSSPPRRQALHLRVGRRPRRRRRHDARPARRQGRRARRDDQRGPPGPARFHDHDRGLQRLLHGGGEAPRRPLGGRPRGGPRGRGADRQAVRRCGGSAARVGPLGRQVLDARDDGHGPQPRAQRGDAPRADRADRQRALRLGRLPAVHPDVRADRHGREARAIRPAPSRPPSTPTAPPRTPT